MQQSLLILPVVIPVIFWAAYHYHKDRHLPEPPLNLALCFGLGLGAAVLSKLMYIGLEPLGLRYDALALGAENPMGLLAYSLLAIGPIEEFAKMLPFLLVVLRFKAYDEPLDGIVYASFIGLGYAASENVYYLDFLTPLESAARGFAGPVVHILFASIWAHWITQAWLKRKPMPCETAEASSRAHHRRHSTPRRSACTPPATSRSQNSELRPPSRNTTLPGNRFEPILP